MAEPKYNPAGDGVTHINVYSNGKTKIGQALSHMHHAPWNTADGQFECFEGWWFWQLAGNSGVQLALFGADREKLRTLNGKDAKKEGTAIVGKKNDWPEAASLATFKAKYEAAAKAKLVQYPDLVVLLRTSTLPLVHYYIVKEYKGELFTYSDPRGDWMMDLWGLFRYKLQHGVAVINL